MKKVLQPSATIATQKIEKAPKYDDQVMVSLDIEFPQLSALRSHRAQRRINSYYQLAAHSFARYASGRFFRDACSDYQQFIREDIPFYPYEAVMRYTVAQNERCLLSIYYQRGQRRGGGAYIDTRFSDTWDLNTGYPLSLPDLFPRKVPMTKKILGAAADIAAEQIKNGGMYFDDYPALMRKYFDPEDFYLTPEGLAVYWQQITVAPHAAGFPTVIIPYETLGIEVPGCLPKAPLLKPAS